MQHDGDPTGLEKKTVSEVEIKVVVKVMHVHLTERMKSDVDEAVNTYAVVC